MSCNSIIFSGCEVAGTTFEGRTIKISGVDISGGIFTAKVKSAFGALLKEIPGVIQNDTAYFSFSEIEDFKRGKYRIEYWAEIPEIGTEVIAVEDFAVKGAGENGGCGGSTIAANLVFEKKEIAVSVNKSVVNFGDGAGANLDAYLKTTVAESTFQKKGNYAYKSEIPTIPPPPNLSQYATKTELSTEAAEREKIGTTVANNAQNIALNSQAVQQISQNVSLNAQAVSTISQAVQSKADKTYVDGKFSEIVGSAPEALNTLYEIAAELQKENGLIEGITATVGKKADITYVESNFQAKGNYLIPADLLPYAKTTDISANYAAKNHTHSFNDISDKPSFFSGKYGDLSGIPTSFNPSAHTHAISEVNGLQTALDGKAAASHTHDALNTQNGGTIKFSTVTQAQYDAIVTKDNTTTYIIT